MKFVTYNIQFSRGKDDRYDLKRIADTVRDADVIALQEVERFWPRSGMQDQPAVLAELLRGHYLVFAPVFDVHAGGPPTGNRRRQFGNLLLSKYPILASRMVVLPKHHYPEQFNMYQGALEGVMQTPLGVLSIWNVHLGYLASAERMSQLAYLREVARRIPDERGAWSGPGVLQGNDWSCGSPPIPDVEHTIWCGDFNSQPDSREYEFVTSAGFSDAAATAGEQANAYTHIRQHSQPPLLRRLDYCFLSDGLIDRVTGYRVDQEAIGSDHQPVWVEFDDSAGH